MKQIISFELLAYLVFIGFIAIEDPFFVVGYLILLVAVYGLIRKKWPGKLEQLREACSGRIKEMAVTGLVLSLTLPFVVQGDPYWLQVFDFALINALMALGLNFMTGRAGLLCLGYAAFEAIGAYTVGILCLKMGFSFWIAFFLGGILSFIFGLVLGLPALRVRGNYLALVTIAFGLVVQEILLNWESVTGGTNGLIDIPAPKLFGYAFDSPVDIGPFTMGFQINFYYMALIVLALSVYLLYKLSNSFFGLILTAMREDELAARCYGINLTKYKLYAFSIGAVFGGFAGAIYAGMINFIAPQNFGYSLSIFVISIIILGGLDSIPGVLIASLFLTIFPEKFRAFADYRVMFYGFIIVLCLLFMREGLMPWKQRIFTSKERTTEKLPLSSSKNAEMLPQGNVTVNPR
ncbi:MAG: branched-chain amino acid ABC transporter permease [Succiniclasticum sp.]|jgi:ABC-type branched-subunit amino acid transport system permease subunit